MFDLTSIVNTQSSVFNNLFELQKNRNIRIPEINTATNRLSSLDVLGGNNTQANIVNDDIKIIDSEWVASRFMTPSNDLDVDVRRNRFKTTSSFKWTDSSMGGNIGINSRPQFTRYADIRNSLRRKIKGGGVTVGDMSGSHGMGRYYSEAIDDNAQTIFMEFGVPKFNSLLDFFMRAVDYVDSHVANTGRLPVGYTAGKIVGGLFMLAAFPILTLTVWAIKTVSKIVFGHKSFEYYYMNPTMHTYWGSVNTIVTNIAIELGILSPSLMPNKTKKDTIGIPLKLDQADIDAFNELMPGVISSGNYVDVFAIATRSQAVANELRLAERQRILDKDFSTVEYLKRTELTLIEKIDTSLSFAQYINDTKSTVVPLPDTPRESTIIAADADTVSKANASGKNNGQFDPNKKDPSTGMYPYKHTAGEKSILRTIAETADSVVRGGGMYASFYVDYTGNVNESFSSSTGDIDLNNKIKNVSKGARDIRFDTAGGNLITGMDSVLGAISGFAAGTLDSITMGLSSVMQTLTGGGYVDIPKKWNDSDMSLPQITYSMQLISVYGNPLSQLKNIYIPLSMLMAGALPLAAGRSSYTSPFLCSLYSKGVQNIKLGMITNLSITRGTSNLGFNKQKRALAIDVSFTVTDFSQRITAPVASSLFDSFGIAPADDTPLANYLGVITSRSILDSRYLTPKVKRRLSKMLMKKEQLVSPVGVGMMVGDPIESILGGITSDHSLSIQHTN